MASRRGEILRSEGAETPGVSSSPTLPELSKQPPVNALLSLREIDAIVDPTERRRLMLDRLEEIRKLASERCYSNKHGDLVRQPDAGTMLRVEEVALEVLGVYAAPASGAGRKPVDLSVFNGGKAEKKAG